MPKGEHSGAAVPVARTPKGLEVRRDPDGRIREVRTSDGGVIQHSPTGMRRVEILRPDGRTVVAVGRGGYVQRPLVFAGQAFVQRTYVMNGIAHPEVFRSWAYGGRQFSMYQPSHYHQPEFYAWAHDPWARPADYQWGWETQPWYGYYGGYCRPYDTYPSPAAWLTDHVVSSTLAAAYLTHGAESTVNYEPVSVMPPEAKYALTEEVQREIAQEQVDLNIVNVYGPGVFPPPPAIFAPNGPTTFLVSAEATAYSGDQEVALTEGAVIKLAAAPSPSSGYVEVQVLASPSHTCPRGSFVFVSTTDLQEMQNHMQATLDQGLDRLQSGQSVAGIPAPPPKAAGTVNAPFANAVQPDTAVLDDVGLLLLEADQAEQELKTS
jgi:hypothetical protein